MPKIHKPHLPPVMLSSDGLDRFAKFLLEFAMEESAQGRFDLPPLIDRKKANPTDPASKTA